MAQVAIGYTLSSEEQAPVDLVKNAQKAEQIGFEFLSISDHYFPWVDAQGQSAFVWSVLGGISQVTKKIPVMTGVTCPILRIHPAILAQASATTAALFGNRFWFGVGTGENLNEHVIGMGWPNINMRLEMLEEAVAVMRELWTGKLVDLRGAYYSVDQARIYSLPAKPPPVLVSAMGPKAAELAAKIGDGLVTTTPDSKTIEMYKAKGGEGKPIYGQITVCFDEDEKKAAETATKYWPNTTISGQASQELPMPLHFEQLTQSVTPDKIAEQVPCGPKVEKYIEAINSYREAGFTHIYLHQIGPEQDKFLTFYQQTLQPELLKVLK